MYVLKNEKVVLIKPMGNLNSIGNVYEVANFTDKKVVLRDERTKIAVASVALDEFETYFAKKESMNVWTDWHDIVDGSERVLGFYKTNGKKVKFKLPDGTKSEATCNKDDDFNLAFGIRLAYERCMIKFWKQWKSDFEEEIKAIEEEMKNCDSKIAESRNTIKRMIRQLDEE